MRKYTYEERAFLRSNRAARYGNKKHRKAKTRGRRVIFNCGCCEWVDNRRKIQDAIAENEMRDYAQRPCPID
jgi:hypothetical protein